MMLMSKIIYKDALSWFFLEMDLFPCKVVQRVKKKIKGRNSTISVWGKNKVNQAKQETSKRPQNNLFID